MSGGGTPNPGDNESEISITDSEEEHERQVEEVRKARDKSKTHHVVDETA